MIEINKIYLGDNKDILKKINDNLIDCIITDPPYIVNVKPGKKYKITKKGSKKSDNNEKYWEKRNFEKKARCDLEKIKDGFDIEWYLNEFERVLKKVNMFIFCSNKQISSIMRWGEEREYFTTLLYWKKTNALPFANNVWRNDTEFIIHIREGGATFQGNAKLKEKDLSPLLYLQNIGILQKNLLNL